MFENAAHLGLPVPDKSESLNNMAVLLCIYKCECMIYFIPNTRKTLNELIQMVRREEFLLVHQTLVS